MRIPRLKGTIKRRLLVNYRADPAIVQRLLPPPFRPKLYAGDAFVGICLIRLEQIRPAFAPRGFGIASENAAHRIAIVWTDPSGAEREGVYILRRDSSSWLNAAVGGRLFPGIHHHAHFAVRDDGAQIDLALRSHDGAADVHVVAAQADALPGASRFPSLRAASAFFEGGSLGFSPTRNATRSDVLMLRIDDWTVRPLNVSQVASGCFDNQRRFPAGSIAFDHALVMRDIDHEWLSAEPMQHA